MRACQTRRVPAHWLLLERISTGDDRWQAHLASNPQWTPAVVIADLNDSRLGAAPGPLPQPAALLRRTFTIAKPVQSARAYVTLLGAYEMYINGHRLGTGILTPMEKMAVVARDAGGECQDRGEGESWLHAQSQQRITQVIQYRFHGGSKSTITPAFGFR